MYVSTQNNLQPKLHSLLEQQREKGPMFGLNLFKQNKHHKMEGSGIRPRGGTVVVRRIPSSAAVVAA